MGHISHYIEYCVMCNCCIQWRLQQFLRILAELKLWALAMPPLLSRPLTCHLLQSASLYWHPTSPSVLLPSLLYFSSGCPIFSTPGQIVGMKDHRSLLFGYSILYKISTALWSIFCTFFEILRKHSQKLTYLKKRERMYAIKQGHFLYKYLGAWSSSFGRQQTANVN